MNHNPIDSPTVVAARLTGSRRAFLAFLSDADAEHVTEHRAEVMVDPSGRIAWDSTPLPGDVTAWHRAEVAVGGAA